MRAHARACHEISRPPWKRQRIRRYEFRVSLNGAVVFFLSRWRWPRKRIWNETRKPETQWRCDNARCFMGRIHSRVRGLNPQRGSRHRARSFLFSFVLSRRGYHNHPLWDRFSRGPRQISARAILNYAARKLGRFRSRQKSFSFSREIRPAIPRGYRLWLSSGDHFSFADAWQMRPRR